MAMIDQMIFQDIQVKDFHLYVLRYHFEEDYE